jgi:hypothetical protein
MRVFLIPQNESTLGHYLAMYDDLYCSNVYNFFNSNPILSLCGASMRENREKQVPRDLSQIIQTLF